MQREIDIQDVLENYLEQTEKNHRENCSISNQAGNSDCFDCHLEKQDQDFEDFKQEVLDWKIEYRELIDQMQKHWEKKGLMGRYRDFTDLTYRDFPINHDDMLGEGCGY